MKSIVPVHSISGASTKEMKYQVMGCLENEFPDRILLCRGINDLRSEESAEKIASYIINVVFSAENTNALFMFQD